MSRPTPLDEQSLSHRVRAHFATDFLPDGSVDPEAIPRRYAEGTVVEYCAAPMVCILTDGGGEYIWWRADLAVDLDANPAACRCNDLPPHESGAPGCAG